MCHSATLCLGRAGAQAQTMDKGALDASAFSGATMCLRPRTAALSRTIGRKIDRIVDTCASSRSSTKTCKSPYSRGES